MKENKFTLHCSFRRFISYVQQLPFLWSVLCWLLILDSVWIWIISFIYFFINEQSLLHTSLTFTVLSICDLPNILVETAEFTPFHIIHTCRLRAAPYSIPNYFHILTSSSLYSLGLFLLLQKPTSRVNSTSEPMVFCFFTFLYPHLSLICASFHINMVCITIQMNERVCQFRKDMCIPYLLVHN